MSNPFVMDKHFDAKASSYSINFLVSDLRIFGLVPVFDWKKTELYQE